MFLGADLSYVNEVEDNGGVFYDAGRPADPFAILHRYGANIVRVRLWHTPTWTAYSTLDDVQQTMQRAKALGMAVMLDLHYSDSWADPAQQVVPAAWAHLDDPHELAQAVYEYTRDVLCALSRHDLTPDFVQVGNEINTEMLLPAPPNGAPINWTRNALLVNAGIRGVRDAGQKTAAAPQVVLHIAQPENILPWFDAAHEAGVRDFDVIGMSYYPKWSTYSLAQTGHTISQARARYDREMMVVETAYPWTLQPGAAASHLMGADAILPGYPATPQGQRDFLLALTAVTQTNGGSGVIYWEPAWVSTTGHPSVWENATFFDADNATHDGITFLAHNTRSRA
ncbi:MAG: glycosyl hydrolase 53 family protein [Anaerolineae bacterium]|nr:glycosyl hydrolase 53 family protein [Anaerolineae bacterium]